MATNIFINPNLATNGTDVGKPGWYIESLNNTSNLALRVVNSNIALTGEIRFNDTSSVFQGYDGSTWSDFNATQGPTGPAGQDFLNVVNFNNIGPSVDSSSIVTYGSIFKTASIDASMGVSNVDIRKLTSGNVTVNGLDVSTLQISQNSNIITLTPQALPYNWSFTANNTVAYYKSGVGDSLFKAYGDVSQWVVKSTSTVSKGTVVRLTSDATSSNIVITPFTYTITGELNPYDYPTNVLGVALEDAVGGSTCNVCTRGVTTVLCTTSSITAQFVSTSNVNQVGRPGLLGKNGSIFCCNQQPTTDTYIKMGYFLETGASAAADGAYTLFFVEPKVSI